MSSVSDWNAKRVGKASSRHPFTGMGSNSKACAICIHGPDHEVHSGAQVISLDQFRKRKS